MVRENGGLFESRNSFGNRFFANQREVHHEAGHAKPERVEVFGESSALGGSEEVWIGEVAFIERNFDVVVSNFLTLFQRFTEGNILHSVQTESQTRLGGPSCEKCGGQGGKRVCGEGGGGTEEGASVHWRWVVLQGLMDAT